MLRIPLVWILHYPGNKTRNKTNSLLSNGSYFIQGIKKSLTLLVSAYFFSQCIGGGASLPGPKHILVYCSPHRPLTEMIQYSMERGCPDNSKNYRHISVKGLWGEQFAIDIDQFSRKFQNLRFDTSISIANCSAHRSPTEMSLYFLELSGQPLSIEYWIISVSGLWGEQLIKMCFGPGRPPPDT